MARQVRQILLQRKFQVVPPTATIVEAAAKMREGRVGAVVVMADQELHGIFTERDALYRVLADRLDPETTTVAEIMTTELVTIAPDDTVAHALRLMRDIGFRHLPVVEDDQVLGILSTRDIIAAAEFSALAGSVA
jgi:CBS domain-containing protein